MTRRKMLSRIAVPEAPQQEIARETPNLPPVRARATEPALPRPFKWV